VPLDGAIMSDLSPRRSFSFNDVDLVYSYSEGESPGRLPTIQASPNQPAVEHQLSPETPQEQRAFLTNRKTKGVGPQAPKLDDLTQGVTIDFSLTDEESDLEDQPNPSLLPRRRLPVSPPSSGTKHQRRRSTSLLSTSLEKALPMRRSTSTPTVRPESSVPLRVTDVVNKGTSTHNVRSPPDHTASAKKVALDLLDQRMITTGQGTAFSLPSTPLWTSRPTQHEMDETGTTKQPFSRSPTTAKHHHSTYKFQRQMSMPILQGRPHDTPSPGSTIELRQFAHNFRLPSPTRPRRSSIFRASSYLGAGTDSAPSVYSEQRFPTERSLTDCSDASDHLAVSPSPVKRRRKPSINDEMQQQGEQQSDVSSHKSDGPLFVRQQGRYMLYLSTFAIFGEASRVYIERFFGADCEAPDAVNDVFSPLFRQICVTASGWTEQTGGALFLSLPPNMIGCFIMGLMSNLEPERWPPIPWFRADHPLQQHDALHVALRTGLCGSLTTFASWNTQMIVMLDGTDTELGSQIAPALCGYVIGLFTAIASFLFGIQVSTWMNRWKNPAIKQQQDSEYYSGSDSNMEEGRERSTRLARGASENEMDSTSAPTGSILVLPSLGLRHHTWLLRLIGSTKLPFVLLAILISVYIVADAVMNIPFYRMMWLSALLTPPGAILRWKLTEWAERTTMSSPARTRFQWIEWGTFTANILGSMISVLVTALHSRYYAGSYTKDDTWAAALLIAVKIGFAGSLSTVSTMAKEVHDLARENPNHAKCYYYPIFTIVCCAVVSLSIYMPIVRSGR
jgi:CrcB protein